MRLSKGELFSFENTKEVAIGYWRQMNKPGELYVKPDPNPRFQFTKELDSKSKLFSFAHLPHIGLISRTPAGLVIPGMAFDMFNPSALAALRTAVPGDLVCVTSDCHHEIYKAWNPPAEYIPEEGFQRMYRVKYVDVDTNNFPIAICEEAI